MTRRSRHSKRWIPRLRQVGWVTIAAIGIVVGSATAAAAYFTLTNLGTGAAHAGAIAAPAGFHANSAFPNQATLSWTAPANPAPTGYTLTGPLGAGSTCTSAPSDTTTSCVVKGLTQGTTYAWTLLAKYKTWESPAVTATAATVTPSVTLTPTSGAGGTLVKVTGNGFAASSGLTFSFTPSGGPAATLTRTDCTSPRTTTATGALPTTPCEITIPLTSAIGAGAVTVTDALGDSATAAFTVTSVPVGIGTMTVTPSSAVATSTGNTFAFDFTAGIGGMTRGTVTLTIPSTPTGWTPPSTTKTAVGYVSLTPNTAGTLAVTGRTITVTGVTLIAGKGFAILYGTGGGATGVRVTSTIGTSTFVTDEASTSSGTPATIAVQPKVNVFAAPCAPITGTYMLATGATTHFSLRGASGGNGGNAGGTGAGGTVVTGTLTNTTATTVTLTYTLGCNGSPGGVKLGGTGGAGYAGGGGGTANSAKAGGGGGGGGASTLTFTVGHTPTVVAVAGGGGGGGGKNTNSGKGGGPATATTATTPTPAAFGGGLGTSPSNDSTGGAGGGGGGGGVHATASGGPTGAGGTGGTSYVLGIATFTGITFSNRWVTTGTNGATATIGFR